MINLPGKGFIFFIAAVVVAVGMIGYGIGRDSLDEFTTKTRLYPKSVSIHQVELSPSEVRVDTTFTYEMP